MTAERSRYWPQILALPDRPTEAAPFGLRNAVCERAAILIADAGMEPEAADRMALATTVPGWQPGLFEGWEEE